MNFSKKTDKPVNAEAPVKELTDQEIEAVTGGVSADGRFCRRCGKTTSRMIAVTCGQRIEYLCVDCYSKSGAESSQVFR